MARRFSPTNYVSSFLDSDRPDYGELGALGVRARFNEEATSRLWDAEVDANKILSNAGVTAAETVSEGKQRWAGDKMWGSIFKTVGKTAGGGLTAAGKHFGWGKQDLGDKLDDIRPGLGTAPPTQWRFSDRY